MYHAMLVAISGGITCIGYVDSEVKKDFSILALPLAVALSGPAANWISARSPSDSKQETNLGPRPGLGNSPIVSYVLPLL